MRPETSEITKQKIRQKIANVVLLQEKQDEAYKDWVNPEKYTAREQQRRQAEWVNAITVEAQHQLEEPENKYFADLRERANGGDMDAKAEFAKWEEAFKQSIISQQEAKPTPAGTCVKRALKHLNDRRKAERAGTYRPAVKTTPQAQSKAAQPSTAASRTLPKDGRKSLESAFDSFDWNSRQKLTGTCDYAKQRYT